MSKRLSPAEVRQLLDARAFDDLKGTIEAGKLADLVIVDGNPLENVANAHKVKRVIANGRVYGLDELVSGSTVSGRTPSSGQ